MEDKVEAAPAIYRQPFLSLARLTPGSTDRIIIVVWTGIMTEARTSLNELVCVYVCACVFFSSSSSSFFFLSFLFLVSSLLSLGAGVPMVWCLSTLPHVYRFRASFVAPVFVERIVTVYATFALWIEAFLYISSLGMDYGKFDVRK